ncbi:SDR family NAD(P)-dependent oxidoreductase [Bosea sp. BK604]|uniref:SDR family NAD(P)-dependent oxidoreductase n=1 Tax=Bosea sp. BK604 TaxID=2512180 RepID=UPI001053A590|nr:SDR family NAD(P)-dependent oxidoreductase [Bosea sp. BK604]TCR65507.1 3-oxoacyl-[acyl-carrier protein] reductase [Bosea sp. BK604]
MRDLENKIALVTGSSSGIGEAVALAFADYGAHVAVHYRSRRDEAEAVAARIRDKGCKSAVFQADVADTAQLARLAADVLAEFGRIDVLVNNAGGFVRRARLSEASDALIDEIFHVNGRSMLALSREVVPAMRRQGGGAIINMTSQAARTGASPGAGLYASTKAYVSTFTRALAKELVPDGIRVNAVAPGVIATPIHDGHTSPELLKTLEAGIPMKRLGRAEECAGAVLFLASEELASYVTGQVIEVNGGSVMP